MRYLSDSKLNKKGFSLVELVVSMAIMIIIAGAILVFLQGSLGQYSYNENNVNLQIESQQYNQRIGNAIMITNYGVYAGPTQISNGTSTDTYTVQSLFLFNKINKGTEASPDYYITVDEYYAKPSGTYKDNTGAEQTAYAIYHGVREIREADFTAANGNYTTNMTKFYSDAEPFATGIKDVTYTISDENNKPLTEADFTSTTVVKTPKRVHVKVTFVAKDKSLQFEDATYFFRNTISLEQRPFE